LIRLVISGFAAVTVYRYPVCESLTIAFQEEITQENTSSTSHHMGKLTVIGCKAHQGTSKSTDPGGAGKKGLYISST
jgi:hypothetical protein